MRKPFLALLLVPFVVMMFLPAASATTTSVPYLSVYAGIAPYTKEFTYTITPSKSLYNPSNRPNRTIDVTCTISNITTINDSACMLNYSTTYQTTASDGTPITQTAYTSATINQTMSANDLNAYVTNALTPWDFFFISNDTNSSAFNSTSSTFEINITSTKLGDGNVTWGGNGVLLKAVFYQAVNMSINNQFVLANATIEIAPYYPAPAAIPGTPIPATFAFTLAGIATVITFAVKKGKLVVRCK
jgi:hypothetical protein